VEETLILGCGYLGRVLAEQWLTEGRRVAVTTRSPQRAAEWRHLGLHAIVCDVLDPDSLRSLPDAGVVAYCVGFDRSTGRSMREVYVDGLANVLTELAGRERSERRFVYVSSSGVYGQTDGGVVDEESAALPAEESGRVVLAAEETLRRLLPAAIVLRFAGIYGPGRLIGAQAVRSGVALTGDPEAWLNLIHVADGASAVRTAVARGRDGTVYNVCDDRPVRRRDYYVRLAERLGAPPPTFAPGQFGTNRRISNRRLRQELGWMPGYPGYEEGLAASIFSPGGAT
jgi:nucleoside-diphosphate-sugar epimerase